MVWARFVDVAFLMEATSRRAASQSDKARAWSPRRRVKQASSSGMDVICGGGEECALLLCSSAREQKHLFFLFCEKSQK